MSSVSPTEVNWVTGGQFKCVPSVSVPLDSLSRWGSWTCGQHCLNSNLFAFRLKVSPPQGDGDDTAANSIMFMCSDKTILEANKLSWGKYGRWSQYCELGICGISTRVEEYQGKGDDTALNDVKFTCCEN
ncbi:vitelline membrane outer layer protein 1-like isoform X2 [Ascaphus truei]|uniref:vitelline membrane outer layer protein 1-like isoform X2 n=1 Tax=Ascaphus truei TaxID=8439 RepID=UPI003F595509